MTEEEKKELRDNFIEIYDALKGNNWLGSRFTNLYFEAASRILAAKIIAGDYKEDKESS